MGRTPSSLFAHDGLPKEALPTPRDSRSHRVKCYLEGCRNGAPSLLWNICRVLTWYGRGCIPSSVFRHDQPPLLSFKPEAATNPGGVNADLTVIDNEFHLVRRDVNAGDQATVGGPSGRIRPVTPLGKRDEPGTSRPIERLKRRLGGRQSLIRPLACRAEAADFLRQIGREVPERRSGCGIVARRDRFLCSSNTVQPGDFSTERMQFGHLATEQLFATSTGLPLTLQFIPLLVESGQLSLESPVLRLQFLCNP